MDNIELIINGQRLEAANGNAPEITRQIAKIGEIGFRAGDFSTEMMFPQTSENLNIIENSQIIGASTDFPYGFREASLIVNGVRIFDKGLAYLNSVEDEMLSFIAFGSLVNLAKKWDGEKAQNLFLPELDIPYATILNPSYAGNTWEQGWCPLTAYYQDEPLAAAGIRPALFCAYLLKKLFESEGYSVRSEIFNDPIFNRAVIPFVGEVPTYGQRQFDDNFFEVTSGANNFSLSSGSIGATGYESVVIEYAPAICSYVMPTSGSFSFGGELFGISEYLDTSSAELSATTQTVIKINGVQYFGGFISVTAGDTIELFAAASFYANIDPLAPVAVSGDLISSWTGARLFLSGINTTITAGDDLHFEQLLPSDWTKLDLFKAIVNTFAIFCDVSNAGDSVHLFFLKKVVENKANAYDYTEKFSGGYAELHFHPEDYGKINRVIWLEDDEKAAGLDYSFEIYDETLQPSVDIVELEFAATYENPSDGIAIIPIFTGVPPEYQEKKPRVLIAIGRGSFVDGRFSPLRLADFYGVLPENFLKRYKKLKAYVRMYASEILTFDFSRPIYLQQFNEYFFVESFEAYTSEADLTILNLIRI